MSQQITIERTVAEFSESHPLTADQLLPLLHSIHNKHGHIPADAIGLVAEALNVSRAEVFGVVSFYDDFSTVLKAARVEICAAEACQALGCRSLLAEAGAALEPNVVVEEVFCLGNCAAGPSARIADKILGRATLASIQAVLDS
jgi:formate dehydrogenase subunit gamma